MSEGVIILRFKTLSFALNCVMKGILIHLRIVSSLQMGERGILSYSECPSLLKDVREVILPSSAYECEVGCSFHMTLLSFP